MENAKVDLFWEIISVGIEEWEKKKINEELIELSESLCFLPIPISMLHPNSIWLSGRVSSSTMHGIIKNRLILPLSSVAVVFPTEQFAAGNTY